MKTAMGFAFTLLLIVALQAASIDYTLTIDEPETHTARITMTLPATGDSVLYLAMPAWSQGRYVIYNFSQNVFDVKARCPNGHLLPVTLMDKQTWSVQTEQCDSVTISYRVFANTLDGTFSRIDSNGASVNGASLFMYLRGRKAWPIDLKVNVPASWQVICPLPVVASHTYYAQNYDDLTDSPLEMGMLHTYSFDHLHKKHKLVFHQSISADFLKPFTLDLKQVISTQAKLFDLPLPYKEYLFFYHLHPGLVHTDGMEHRNACRVLLRVDMDSIATDANLNPDYDNLIWLTAHEYFHLWNGKRLRPQGLGPFDYSKEVYTNALWIVEGLTSYFAYLALVRSGIYTREKFYDEIAGRISRYENDPGKKHRTLEEVSLLTWLFKGNIPQYGRTHIQNTTYSYYYKGIITGLLLDLLIRKKSDNNYSLDTVMQRMYNNFYYKKKDAYFRGTGYTLKDFERTAAFIAQSDLQDFFNQTVRSTQAMPYHLLKTAGLELIRQNQTNYMVQPVSDVSKAQKRIRQSWLGKP
ncbi:MAG: hypothetical protein GF313_09610 [Caldithrix sp.]|nr:hypothetical protein [Caldithrix sp.]